MTTTYLSAAVLDQLGQAQTVMDMHLTFSRSGVCGLCKEADPCAQRMAAEQLFAQYMRLPRRTPGLTLATASLRSGAGWLDEAAARRIAEAVEEPSS